MTVTVQSTDVQNYNLQAQVAAVQTLVNANANAAVQPALIALLDSLQQQLVANLMANSTNRTPGAGCTTQGKPNFLTASGILSSGTINT